MPGVTIQTDHAALEASVARYLRPWLQAKLDSIAALAVQLAPVDTGLLRDNHYTEIVGDGVYLLGRVVANTAYALYVHNGTRPHSINPRSAGGVLRFPNRAGVIVYTRHVNHPGTTAQPWLRDAAVQVISISSGA